MEKWSHDHLGNILLILPLSPSSEIQKKKKKKKKKKPFIIHFLWVFLKKEKDNSPYAVNGRKCP